MSLLARKMKTGIGSEDMRKQIVQVDNTPSQVVEAEKLIRTATKASALPSEVQKTMSEILAERLRMSKQSTKDIEGMTERLQKNRMTQQTDLVNMGQTLVKDDNTLAKGKKLG